MLLLSAIACAMFWSIGSGAGAGIGVEHTVRRTGQSLGPQTTCKDASPNDAKMKRSVMVWKIWGYMVSSSYMIKRI